MGNDLTGPFYDLAGTLGRAHAYILAALADSLSTFDRMECSNIPCTFGSIARSTCGALAGIARSAAVLPCSALAVMLLPLGLRLCRLVWRSLTIGSASEDR